MFGVNDASSGYSSQEHCENDYESDPEIGTMMITPDNTGPDNQAAMPVSPKRNAKDWIRHAAFWIGAVVVGLAAIAFAKLADGAGGLFAWMLGFGSWVPFILAPAGLALSVLLTKKFFPGAQGSGIPQVIASLHMADARRVDATLSLRIAAGKVLLTLLGLCSGASIGREGPTVQVSATIMHALGRLLRLPREDAYRAMVLGGGAAGIAAAFNTPLAGVVFAIEELSHSFEARTSGTVLTAVIISGITTMALVGNYSYFGVASASLPWGIGWIAVLACGIGGGLAGGCFSSALLWFARGVPGAAGRWTARHPIAFAALCGLALAIIGFASKGTSYGTGYEQASGLVGGTSSVPHGFVVLKFLASVVSYISGIPGGIFAPSLAVGAGLGDAIAQVLPSAAPVGTVVLLGMVGYFCGVVQAPITATIIVMEMTSDGQLTVPLMATSLLAFGASRVVCRQPLYAALADRFLATSKAAPNSPSDVPATGA
jgi:H+/Cl- antiporter ClcA